MLAAAAASEVEPQRPVPTPSTILPRLARFGVREDEILAGCWKLLERQSDTRFRTLMSYEIDRAHALYEAAWPGITMLAPDGQFAAQAKGIVGQLKK